MLPRTFLSEPLPYQRIGAANLIWGGQFTYIDYNRSGLSAIPAAYDERLLQVDGLWDDGERMVVITWMDRVKWPSWGICATWFDRSSGRAVDRLEVVWALASPRRQTGGKAFTLEVEDPFYEFAGTAEPNLAVGGAGPAAYVRGVTRGADGKLYAIQGGSVQAVTRVVMRVQKLVYGYDGFSPSQLPDAALRAGLSEYGTLAAPVTGGGDMRLQVLGVEATSSGSMPTEAELRGVLAGLGPEAAEAAALGSSVLTFAQPTGGVFSSARDQGTARAQLVDPASGLLYRYRVAQFLPGSASAEDAWSFAQLGSVDVSVALVLDADTALVGGVYGFEVRSKSAGLVRFIRTPAMPRALAYEEGSRVWVLMADNTAVCLDYETGEPQAYVWLPLPFSVSATAVQVSWQKDYRRLLVFGILPGRYLDPSAPRSVYNSRVVGYSTTPEPVHVCRPIPLRPVRAGRSTPVLLRQVGSLGEPITGMATVTQGEGVTLSIDRLSVPLDDAGEALVHVTPLTEGAASLSVSISPRVTWQAPGVPAPFVGAPETWIEGL